MDFFTTLQSRYSVRDFSPEPIPEDFLNKILRSTNQAPSAGNLQAYEVYVVDKPEHKDAIVKASYDQEFIGQAPVVLVFCSNPGRSKWKYGERGVKLYSIQDATIACTFAMLSATALGLGSVWIGAFDPVSVQKVLGIPEENIPVAILPIGYEAGVVERRKRRLLDDLVHYL